MTSYTYLGYGTTGSDGVAKLDHDANGDPINHSYTGVGAGEIDVVASLDNPIASGSVVSQPYTVWDTLFYDDGVSGTQTNYTLGTAITKEVGEGYTTISTTSSNSTTGRFTSSTSFTGDIECLIQCNITYESSIGIYVGFRGSNPTSWRIDSSGWKYLRMRRVSGVYSAQISSDGVNWSDIAPYDNNAGTGAVNFYVLIYNSSGSKKTFDFKDLKVYPI